LVLYPEIVAPTVERLYGCKSSRRCHLELHNRVHAVAIAAAGTGPFVVRVKRGGKIEGCFGVAQAGIYPK
jgi:hypothetical protein